MASQLRLKVRGRTPSGEPFLAEAIFQWVRNELRCTSATDNRLDAFRLMNADEVKKYMNQRQWKYDWAMERVVEHEAKMAFPRFKNLEIKGE